MQHLKFRLAVWLPVGLLLLMGLPAWASSGRGIVVEGNPVGADNLSLNPLLCDNPYCRRITDFLFPSLYAVDPQTGLPVGAAEDNYGLVVNPAAPTTDMFTLQLRDDLQWSDGMPVTAYDVFYSYLAIRSQYINTPYYDIRTIIKALRVVDAHAIELSLAGANCSTPAQINFPIVPAHVFDPQFQSMVDDNQSTGDLDTWFTAWLKLYPPTRFDPINTNPFNMAPTVTAGVFQFAGRLPGQEIRLKTADGALAFVYRDLPSGMDMTQFFRSGQSNVLVNPALEVRDDLRADPTLKTVMMPGSTWNYIGLNMADPNLARSAVDGNGKLLEQGHHPLFGDVRVRQAIQKAIHIQPIIDTAVLGYGLPLLSSRIPGTWAANDVLQPLVYDPEGAQRLLAEAGWVDHNGDGARECEGCLYAPEGRTLSFSLVAAAGEGREVAANQIAAQLSQIGIYAYVNVVDHGTLVDQVRNQQFDAYLDGEMQDFPTDGDQTALFTRSGDVLYTGRNYGSYYNAAVEQLMNQALTVPDCNVDARAALYRQIQGVLQDDQPYIWLYATQDMLVTHDIVGANPYPNRPFWNIRDWIVTS